MTFAQMLGQHYRRGNIGWVSCVERFAVDNHYPSLGRVGLRKLNAVLDEFWKEHKRFPEPQEVN